MTVVIGCSSKEPPKCPLT
jgi:hypothetical protein